MIAYKFYSTVIFYHYLPLMSSLYIYGIYKQDSLSLDARLMNKYMVGVQRKTLDLSRDLHIGEGCAFKFQYNNHDQP